MIQERLLIGKGEQLMAGLTSRSPARPRSVPSSRPRFSRLVATRPPSLSSLWMRGRLTAIRHNSQAIVYCTSHLGWNAGGSPMDVVKWLNLLCLHLHATRKKLTQECSSIPYMPQIMAILLFVSAPSTNVVVIAISLASQWEAMLIFLTGTQHQSCCIDFPATAENKGVTPSLIGLHSFTSCDTCSAFSGNGKKWGLALLKEVCHLKAMTELVKNLM